MMETLPAYIAVVFILTTFGCVAFLLQAIKSVGLGRLPSKILIYLLPLWIVFSGALALGGFYQNASSVPPRVFLFGVFPALLLIIIYFLLFRRGFIESMPLRVLTLLHVVRIPVELVLYWLFIGGLMPQMMTFEGRNFDILSGILAPLVYLVAFRGKTTVKWLLVAYNVIGLILLANVVSIAALSMPSPMQQLNFGQPLRAVMFFPYIWLPAIVVPIVLFAHLASLWKLLRA